MSRGFKLLAPLAAQAANDKKGEDILLFDMHRVSILCEYVLLVSVNSPAQSNAIEAAIETVMDAAGAPILHRDGSNNALWRVLDYGGLLVHLMHPEAREFYSLEKLYHDAPKRHWQEEPARKVEMTEHKRGNGRFNRRAVKRP